jgi:hypothetical protein
MVILWICLISCLQDGLCRLGKKPFRLHRHGRNDVYIRNFVFRIHHNHVIRSHHLNMTIVISNLCGFLIIYRVSTYNSYFFNSQSPKYYFKKEMLIIWS